MFVEVNPHDRLVVNVDLPEDESMVEKEAFGWMEVAYVYQSTTTFFGTLQWTGMASWKVTIFNRRYILKWSYFHYPGSFPGCNLLVFPHHESPKRREAL